MIGNASMNQILMFLPALILAFSVHELAHGLTAYALGDSTAKEDGRLSLNPIRHIDPLGLVFIILVGFGWAKPVMVNPNNLRNPKVHMALIAAAGPVSNFILAFLSFMLLVPLVRNFNLSPTLTDLFIRFSSINIVLAVFNLLPVPPLDGSKIIAGYFPGAFTIGCPSLALLA